jgi:hypothetical protein
MCESCPREQRFGRRLERNRIGPDDSPFLIAPDGTMWIDYRPVRVQFTDTQGRTWRISRHWLGGVPTQPDFDLPVVNEMLFTEELNLPMDWDLSDVNINSRRAVRCAGQPASVSVRILPGGVTIVKWCDPEGGVWRLPHDWRRRRIMLPSREVLAAQGVHDDVASECAGQIVSVNYHPGSLCCLPEHYRFRDGRGQVARSHLGLHSCGFWKRPGI